MKISSFVLCILELSAEGYDLYHMAFFQTSAGEVISRVIIFMQESVNTGDF